MNANFPPGSAGRLTGFNKVPQASLLAISLADFTTRNTENTFLSTKGTKIYLIRHAELKKTIFHPVNPVHPC